MKHDDSAGCNCNELGHIPLNISFVYAKKDFFLNVVKNYQTFYKHFGKN